MNPLLGRQSLAICDRVQHTPARVAPAATSVVALGPPDHDAEFERLAPNREFLETIAARTDGELIDLSEIDGLVRRLPQRQAPIMETRIDPWWHRVSIFLLAIGLLVSEWGLRRWKGLP